MSVRADSLTPKISEPLIHDPPWHDVTPARIPSEFRPSIRIRLAGSSVSRRGGAWGDQESGLIKLEPVSLLAFFVVFFGGFVLFGFVFIFWFGCFCVFVFVFPRPPRAPPFTPPPPPLSPALHFF